MPTNPSNSDAEAGRFIVGGVGKRFLPPETRGIERAIDDAFREVATQARADTAQLVLVVSAAEGADRLLIRSASRIGIPYRCVLPCSARCFSRDFSSRESIQEFEDMLDRADEVVVPDFEPAIKQHGYLWASRFILDHADLLLAVWDGAAGYGPAGTAHTVGLAMDRGLPVLWVPTEAPNTPVRLDRVPCDAG